MIDLTPLDVRKKRGDFRSRLRGYDPEEVDSFLELVAERLEALVKENLTLSERAEQQGKQLSTLEEREKAVQDALVSAQKLRADLKDQTREEADNLRKQAEKEVEVLRKQAEREAHLLRKEAEGQIGRRLGSLDSLIRERRGALEELERKRGKFLKAFRNLLERELDGVEVEEARTPLEEIPLDLDLGGDRADEAEEGEWGEDSEPLSFDEGAEILTADQEVDSSPAEGLETVVERGLDTALEEEAEAVLTDEAEGGPGFQTEPVRTDDLVAGVTAEPDAGPGDDSAIAPLDESEPPAEDEPEPTPVEALAPDEGAFVTQKFELPSEPPPPEGIDLDRPAESVAEPPLGDPGDRAVVETDSVEPIIPVPVGEMLLAKPPESVADEPKRSSPPAEEGAESEEAAPKNAEGALEDSEGVATAESAGSSDPLEGLTLAGTEGAEEPTLTEEQAAGEDKQKPFWLSAILKEEEEGSQADEEERPS